MGKVDSWSSRGQEVSHRSIVLDLECTKRHRHKTVVSTHPNKMGERNKKSPDLEVVHVSKRHPLREDLGVSAALIQAKPREAFGV